LSRAELFDLLLKPHYWTIPLEWMTIHALFVECNLSLLAPIITLHVMLILFTLGDLVLKGSPVARFGEHYGDYLHYDQA